MYQIREGDMRLVIRNFRYYNRAFVSSVDSWGFILRCFEEKDLPFKV